MLTLKEAWYGIGFIFGIIPAIIFFNANWMLYWQKKKEVDRCQYCKEDPAQKGCQDFTGHRNLRHPAMALFRYLSASIVLLVIFTALGFLTMIAVLLGGFIWQAIKSGSRADRLQETPQRTRTKSPRNRVSV